MLTDLRIRVISIIEFYASTFFLTDYRRSVLGP